MSDTKNGVPFWGFLLTTLIAATVFYYLGFFDGKALTKPTPPIIQTVTNTVGRTVNWRAIQYADGHCEIEFALWRAARPGDRLDKDQALRLRDGLNQMSDEPKRPTGDMAVSNGLVNAVALIAEADRVKHWVPEWQVLPLETTTDPSTTRTGK